MSSVRIKETGRPQKKKILRHFKLTARNISKMVQTLNGFKEFPVHERELYRWKDLACQEFMYFIVLAIFQIPHTCIHLGFNKYISNLYLH